MSHTLRDIGGAVGASIAATASDGAVFFALLAGDAPVWLAALSAAASGAVVHYTLSRFAVFKRFEAPIPQSALKYVLMSSGAALIYAIGTELTVPIIGAMGAWVLLKITIFVAITYPLSRYWVFGNALQPCEEAP